MSDEWMPAIGSRVRTQRGFDGEVKNVVRTPLGYDVEVQLYAAGGFWHGWLGSNELQAVEAGEAR